MISEGSSDTEAWSNDAENTDFLSLNKYMLTYIVIENSCLHKL